LLNVAKKNAVWLEPNGILITKNLTSSFSFF